MSENCFQYMPERCFYYMSESCFYYMLGRNKRDVLLAQPYLFVQQLCVAPLLDNLAVLDHQNAIRIDDGR